ncbi:MAG: hypothetical protein NVSMB16_08130 [Acidimicrobiales bacterium]
MSDATPRYVFDPIATKGAVAGLRVGQAVFLGSGLMIATSVIGRLPSAAGVVLALLVITAATAAAFVSVAGRPLEQWVAPLTRHVSRRIVGRTARGPNVTEPAPPPAVLAGISFGEVRQLDGTALGVITDRSSATVSAVMAVRGRSFALLDPGDKARCLSSWSTVLAGLAREDGPVRRLQWIERTVPGDGAVLTRHLERGCALDASDPRVRSYAELVETAGPLAEEHEILLVLSVRARGRRGRHRGDGGHDVLTREMRLLEGQLRHAGVDVVGPLGLRGLSAAIRHGFDPWSRAALVRRGDVHPDLAGTSLDAAWPTASEAAWPQWRTDGTWHATFWIAEWPRSDVGPDFLSPLLLGCSRQRTVTVVMAPLAPSVGTREVEAARTAHAADDQLRQRAGFLATARRNRQAEGALRRETELADGHAAYRFSGYVTVSARSAEELEDACGEVVHAGHQARLELRRLYGAQDLAFTWTLPLGRGLASR